MTGNEMAQPDWQARLIIAMHQRRINVSELHRQLDGLVSYGTTWAYVNDPEPVSPRVEFIEAAAKVLRVRAAWLAFGDGPMEPWITPLDTKIGELERELSMLRAKRADHLAACQPDGGSRQGGKGGWLPWDGALGLGKWIS